MAGIFGAANITPLIYEEMRDSEAGICTGFLDAIGAKTGGAGIWKGTIRVTFWGVFAMGVTAGIGAALGKSV